MRINWRNLLTVSSASVLVGVQTVALGVVTGWAAAGLLGLGDVGAYFLEAVLGALALAGTIAFMRMAVRAEPLIDHAASTPNSPDDGAQ